MYWSGDHKIVVTRHPMDDTHIADINAILGYESLIFRTVPSGSRAIPSARIWPLTSARSPM